MRRFYHYKLVRDKRQENIEQYNGIVIGKNLVDAELLKALQDKLLEEVEEYIAAPNKDIAKELADVQEVLETLVSLHKITRIELEKIRELKNKKTGEFTAGAYIEYIELPEDHPYLNYYVERPEQYPEVDPHTH